MDYVISRFPVLYANLRAIASIYNPDIVKQLTQHLVVPSKIMDLNIETVLLTPKLINDSLTIKIMKELGISNLASNDLDFERVDWLNLYLPSSGGQYS